MQPNPGDKVTWHGIPMRVSNVGEGWVQMEILHPNFWGRPPLSLTTRQYLKGAKRPHGLRWWALKFLDRRKPW